MRANAASTMSARTCLNDNHDSRHLLPSPSNLIDLTSHHLTSHHLTSEKLPSRLCALQHHNNTQIPSTNGTKLKASTVLLPPLLTDTLSHSPNVPILEETAHVHAPLRPAVHRNVPPRLPIQHSMPNHQRKPIAAPLPLPLLAMHQALRAHRSSRQAGPRPRARDSSQQRARAGAQRQA